MSKDLKLFLDESKKISEKQNKIYDYNISPIKVNNFKGYLVNYKMEVKKGIIYRCYEYFIDGKGKSIRFSFFIREENFKENMPEIFSTIVKTADILE